MVAAISATPDVPNQRIGVQLSGWAADGPLTVSRVHPDTSAYPVRGITATSGGAAFGWDYEAPFGVPVTYVAMNGSTQVTSSAATLAITDAWLTSPGLPSYSVKVTPTARPTVNRVRPAGALQVWGRPNPVVLTDSRKAGTFDVAVRCFSLTEADDLDAVLDSAPTLLLRIPGTRQDWQYVTVTSSPSTPATGYAGAGVGQWETFTLSCIVTDPPIGGVYGDPTASYQAIKDGYATYSALRSGKASYLAVLQGV